MVRAATRLAIILTCAWFRPVLSQPAASPPHTSSPLESVDRRAPPAEGPSGEEAGEEAGEDDPARPAREVVVVAIRDRYPPRVIVYAAIMSLALAGIVYGLASLSTLELNVLHERQPLFVQQSDGSIQNRYTLKLLNKTPDVLEVKIEARGLPGLAIIGAEEPVAIAPGKVSTVVVFLRVPGEQLAEAYSPVTFEVAVPDDPAIREAVESVFVGPG